jgi:mRNA interferase RelE/StbE/toxin YoeB
MTYTIEISAHTDRIFKKMSKRERKELEAIDNKIKQIRENPCRFKPLSGDMHGSRRVHLNTSFVLVYEIDEQRKTVRILDYDHHDKVY